MRRPYLLIAITLLIHGCVANDTLGTDAAAQINIQHLSRLNIGMHQPEVLCIMRKPYKQEAFEFDGATFDVWFYVTKPTVLGQKRKVPANLTPLTFKNGELIGWGFSYYKYLLKRQKAEKLMQKGETPAYRQTFEPKEDIELEKSLQNTLQAPQSPAQPRSSQQTPPQQPGPTQPQPAPKQPSQGKQSSSKTGGKQPAGQSPQQTPTNWGPIDRSQPQSAPQQGTSGGKTVSMSSKPKTTQSSSSQKTPNKTPEKKNPPLDEQDRKMLEEESEQNFNQN